MGAQLHERLELRSADAVGLPQGCATRWRPACAQQMGSILGAAFAAGKLPLRSTSVARAIPERTACSRLPSPRSMLTRSL